VPAVRPGSRPGGKAELSSGFTPAIDLGEDLSARCAGLYDGGLDKGILAEGLETFRAGAKGRARTTRSSSYPNATHTSSCRLSHRGS